MGCYPSKKVEDGALIVDSVVISNCRVRVSGDIISIPIKDLRNGESSVINIDRKAGIVRIARGMIHGKLSHDSIIEEFDISEPVETKKSRMSRESLSL